MEQQLNGALLHGTRQRRIEPQCNNMKIVILDGFTANPGDLSWEEWNNLGDVTVCDRTAPEDIVKSVGDAEIVITNKVVFSRDIIQQLPNLRYIGVLATGYNVVDLEAARQHNIAVTNIPAYSTMSVAQMVFAHILNITNQVHSYSQKVNSGSWQNSRDFCILDAPILELDGKTLGIIGLGNIGMAVARIAQSLGMKILAVSSKSQETLQKEGITKARDYSQLFSESDILSLHCPLTPETQHLVNRENLSLMKSSAIIINTGRGPLVDEDALAEALNTGTIAAAGIDVLEQEPPRSGSPLIGARNCYITPHIAWASFAARQRLLHTAYTNVLSFLDGKKVNRVE